MREIVRIQSTLMENGLKNPRATTCYANVVVQTFVATPPIRRAMDAHYRSNVVECPGSCFLCGLRSIALATPKNRPIDLTPLWNILPDLQRDFEISEQEDAHEFMILLLRNSSIANVCTGLLNTSVLCQGCMTSKPSRDELFNILSIPLKPTLEEALNDFAESTIDGQRCETCGGQRSHLKEIEVYPETILIHLKRSIFDEENQSIVKMQEYCSFPEILDLSEHLDPQNKSGIKVSYKLCSIITHEGESVASGHYISFSKDPSTQSWFRADDERITSRVTWDNVMEQQVYILSYEKVALCKSATPSDLEEYLIRDPVFIRPVCTCNFCCDFVCDFPLLIVVNASELITHSHLLGEEGRTLNRIGSRKCKRANTDYRTYHLKYKLNTPGAGAG